MNSKIFIFILISAIFSGHASALDLVKISNGSFTVAIDLEVGGRVMEYSKSGNNVLFINPEYPQKTSNPDGGRCDFGPEKIAPPRPETWLGKWELIEEKDNFITIKEVFVKLNQLARGNGLNPAKVFRLPKTGF